MTQARKSPLEKKKAGGGKGKSQDNPPSSPSDFNLPTSASPRVAILGGGPAGSTLATLLAERSMDVVLFDDARRPDLLVGESLIPAVVPIFRRLGIEDRVAAIGVVKPGVSFLLTDQGQPLDLSFKPVGKRLPQYAYNVPRPAFDDLMRQRAREAGVRVVGAKAGVERAPGRDDAVRLDAKAMDQAPRWHGRQPDLIVDCTGRRRTIARLMDIPSRDGERSDVALFAHFENFSMRGLVPGQVVTGILKEGWSWCIPLRDRVSVGVVVHREHLKKYGPNPEDQLAGVMQDDPHLSARTAEATRLSEVVRYTNYQKIGQRGHGANWVLLGDAFGFVDPMFSPGLFLAMRSAEILADALEKLRPRKFRFTPAGPRPIAAPRFRKALGRYDREMHGWFEAWGELIEFIYRGDVLAMREAGMEWLEQHPGRIGRWFSGHMEQQMACMAAGQATRSHYAWSLLRFGTRYGMRGKDPAKYRVK